MAACNYQDVVDQLHAAGLVGPEVDEGLRIGRMTRCRVEGDREKRGWYMLHELQGNSGDLLLVGSFGVWQGQANNAQKIELRKSEFSAEQRESLRKRLAEDRKRADRQRADEATKAAERASKAWAKCEPTGDAEYLAAKGVLAHGLRFAPSGAAVIPLLDTAGKIHGLQVIRTAAQAKAKHRPAKEFWPVGLAKKGFFHLIGTPTWIVLVAEGYATAASVHEATGLPVAVAFDAGNLAPVAAALRKRYKLVKILIAADDDIFAKCQHCGARVDLTPYRDGSICEACDKEHGRSNTGVMCASAAALEVNGAWVVPCFADPNARHQAFVERGIKLSDWNDLHASEGLHVVRTQIEARLSELGWSPAGRRARPLNNGGAGKDGLRPIETIDELLERFALVYGQGGTVFDRQEHCLLALSDMRDACMTREIHRAWAEHPDRDIVRVREVGFDPGLEDPAIKCNLWAGWPTEAKAGQCDKLLELLRYMCSDDGAPNTLFGWVLDWIAYPIQHHGAKMKTTLVLHGPQGTGKNMFFEALMAIYGHYGRVIDQSAIEDRFNDWSSRKLFLIADEVIARSDLYHVKNKLKAFITGEWIRINPKNMAAYDERNHVNIVFLSNEAMPVVLEEDDRRHAVIWTPKKLGHDFYLAVMAEIKNGGIAALHDYLLHHDLRDFQPGTLPPYTDAKAELINLSLDSTSRFFNDLVAGDIEGVKARPALSSDVFDLYRAWCGRTNHRAAPMPRLINVLARKHDVACVRKRYSDITGTRGPHGVLMLGAAQLPPGDSETNWLGDHILAFRRSVGVYKGEAYD
jgi:putative DNA primase/helicase